VTPAAIARGASEAVSERILKLTVEYDGTNYVGWQRQAEGVSIQALIEDALAPFEGRAVTVHAAGRTDAGVHALAQVASVVTSVAHDVATLQRALNAVLPADVRITSVEDAPSGFHARFDAVSKTYEYRIVNAPYASAFQQRYVWHVPGALNLDDMRAGAAVLVGRHDFSAFQATGAGVSTTVRTILALDLFDRDGSASEPAVLVLRITGDGFLRHMVRTIAGTLVDVGLGRWPAAYVSTILAGRDRTRAGRAAPAAGLFLVEVSYAARDFAL
jgi:tRNA pseudouridine38-40 synthase